MDELLYEVDGKTKESVETLIDRICPKQILDLTEDQNQNKVNAVINNLKNPNVGSLMIAAYLQGFGSYLTMLNITHHKSLISSLIEVRWFEKEFLVAAYYSDFISAFLATHNEYADEVLSHIFNVFDGVVFLPKIQSQSLDKDGVLNYFRSGRKIIKAILDRVPSVLKNVRSILDFKFPNPRKTRLQTENYLNNAFLLVKMLPPYDRPLFLDTLIEKIRAIDSHTDTEVLKSLQSDTQAETTQFHMESVEQSNNANASPNSVDNHELEMSMKLDHAMKLLLDYIQDACYRDDMLIWRKTKRIFTELLGSFDRLVLKAGDLSHLHFFLFYICTFREDLTYGFIGYLGKRIDEPTFAESYRLRAVGFLTDFLCRSRCVSVETLKDNLRMMADWCHSYVANHQDLDSTSSIFETHKLFYSMAFSVFHILLFRWKDIFGSVTKGDCFCKRLNLQSIISCRFNPLFYCEEAFLRSLSDVLQYYEVAYCHAVIEENKRDQIKSQNYSALLGNIITFPFKSYLLPSTSELILPYMRDEMELDIPSCEQMVSTASKEIKSMNLSDDSAFHDSHDLSDVAMLSVSPQRNLVFEAIVGQSSNM